MASSYHSNTNNHNSLSNNNTNYGTIINHANKYETRNSGSLYKNVSYPPYLGLGTTNTANTLPILVSKWTNTTGKQEILSSPYNDTDKIDGSMKDAEYTGSREAGSTEDFMI